MQVQMQRNDDKEKEKGKLLDSWFCIKKSDEQIVRSVSFERLPSDLQKDLVEQPHKIDQQDQVLEFLKTFEDKGRREQVIR